MSQNTIRGKQPSRTRHLGFTCFSYAPVGWVVEEWRHNWSRWRSELLHHHWSQSHHKAGPPLWHCKLYLCCQKHRGQEKKHNRHCHSLWWVSFSVLHSVLVQLQYHLCAGVFKVLCYSSQALTPTGRIHCFPGTLIRKHWLENSYMLIISFHESPQELLRSPFSVNFNTRSQFKFCG